MLLGKPRPLAKRVMAKRALSLSLERGSAFKAGPKKAIPFKGMNS